MELMGPTAVTGTGNGRQFSVHSRLHSSVKLYACLHLVCFDSAAEGMYLVILVGIALSLPLLIASVIPPVYPSHDYAVSIQVYMNQLFRSLLQASRLHDSKFDARLRLEY